MPTASVSAENGVHTAYGTAKIPAPASEVWAVLMDFSSYSKWNSYTPSFIPPAGDNKISVGDMCQVEYRLDTSETLKPITMQIMSLSAEEMTVCWKACPTGYPDWTICGETVQKVARIDEEECKFEVLETHTGPLAYAVKWTIGERLVGMNHGIADDLYKYIKERRAR